MSKVGIRKAAGSGGLLAGGWLIEHAHDVELFYDDQLLAIDLDLAARPFTEQHAIADTEVNRDEFSAVVPAAWPNRNDLALRRLFLGGVRDDDATGGFFLRLNTTDQHTIVQRTELHELLLSQTSDVVRPMSAPGSNRAPSWATVCAI